ncbi:MAG: hypothetical protein AAF598_20895, partial [Bacteroidota bacterium]
MKRFHLLLLLLSWPIIMAAQENYNDFKKKRQEHVVLEDFNRKSKQFWTGNDGRQKGNMAYGLYQFKSLDNLSRFNAPYFPIDVKQDFELECMIAYRHGKLPFGVVWGDSADPTQLYFFQVSNLGLYSISNRYEVLKKGDLAAPIFKKAF